LIGFCAAGKKIISGDISVSRGNINKLLKMIDID
jgi:hypothetical protein